MKLCGKTIIYLIAFIVVASIVTIVTAATLNRDGAKDSAGSDYGLMPRNSPSVGDVLTAGDTGTIWTNTAVRVWSGTSGGIVVPVGSPVFMPPNNSAASLSTSDSAGATRCPVTRQTILQNLFVVVSMAPGASKTNTFTLMTNGVASALSANVIGTATSGNDTVHNVTIPAWTEIGIRVTTSPGSVGGKASWGFEGR